MFSWVSMASRVLYGTKQTTNKCRISTILHSTLAHAFREISAQLVLWEAAVFVWIALNDASKCNDIALAFLEISSNTNCATLSQQAQDTSKFCCPCYVRTQFSSFFKSILIMILAYFRTILAPFKREALLLGSGLLGHALFMLSSVYIASGRALRANCKL